MVSPDGLRMVSHDGIMIDGSEGKGEINDDEERLGMAYKWSEAS